MITLDLLERLSTTVVGFLKDRPAKFFQDRERMPNKYVSPVMFAICAFLLGRTSSMALSKIQMMFMDFGKLASRLQGDNLVTKNMIHAVSSIGDVDLSTYLVFGAALEVLGFMGNFAIFAIVCKILKMHAAARDLVIALCYSSATKVFGLFAETLTAILVIVVGVFSPAAAPLCLWLGLLVGFPLLIVQEMYTAGSVAALVDGNFWPVFLVYSAIKIILMLGLLMGLVALILSLVIRFGL